MTLCAFKGASFNIKKFRKHFGDRSWSGDGQAGEALVSKKQMFGSKKDEKYTLVSNCPALGEVSLKKYKERTIQILGFSLFCAQLL